jgi:hypothetical protein
LLPYTANGLTGVLLAPLLLVPLYCLLVQMGASERMMVLMRLPAVHQLDKITILQLLQTAVEKKLHRSVQLLCELPVLQAAPDGGQSNAVWSTIWSTAVGIEGPATLRALCQLSAACAAVRDVVPLLHAAVRFQDTRKLGCLCQLPAAADVSSDDAAALLQVAVEEGSTVKVAELVQLPVLQAASDGGQSNTVWSNIWSTAVGIEGPATLRALCQLPAACAVVRDVLPRLHAAVHCKDSLKLDLLCQLPAAADVSAHDAAALLQVAVEEGSGSHVAALVQLQAVQAVTFESLLR